MAIGEWRSSRNREGNYSRPALPRAELPDAYNLFYLTLFFSGVAGKGLHPNGRGQTSRKKVKLKRHLVHLATMLSGSTPARKRMAFVPWERQFGVDESLITIYYYSQQRFASGPFILHPGRNAKKHLAKTSVLVGHPAADCCQRMTRVEYMWAVQRQAEWVRSRFLATCGSWLNCPLVF